MKTQKQYKELTVREFTRAANRYETSRAGIYEMCREDYPYIEEELSKEEYTDLLDCGCGTGAMISILYEKDPSKHYTGLDITPAMIGAAKNKNLSGVQWVVGDSENMPFEEAGFDVIICSNSFHHYPNPQAFFNSAFRVLRPGGRLILQDYSAPGPLLWLMNHMEMPLANLTGHGDVAARSLQEIRTLCENAGLKVEKLKRAEKFRMHLVARKPGPTNSTDKNRVRSEMEKGDNKVELQLGDVQTTALIPVAIKAGETLRKKPRIRDPKAVEIIQALQLDTRPYDKFLSHEGVVARTIMLDRQMKSIIKKHPDTVVVNLGAGFDDRFSRVDNGRILWFDIDLADSIAARKKAFPERDRVTMVEADVLKEDWFGAIEEALKGRQSKPVFIAEGLFMYFTLEQIADLLRNIVRHFPDGGLMIAEQNCKLMAGNEKHHDAVKSTNARFLSGTDSAQEIADMVDGLQLVEEHSFNEEMKKYTLRGRLFAMLVPKMNNRWATFRWGGKTF